MIAPLHKDESPIRRHLTCGAQAQWYSTARRRLQLQIMVSDALLIRRVSQKKKWVKPKRHCSTFTTTKVEIR